MKKKQHKYSKQLFHDSLIKHTLFFCSDVLTREEINFLATKINFKKISDNLIKNNYDLLGKINWSLFIDKYQALRISVSHLIDGLDISKYPLFLYKYDFQDVITSVQTCPKLLDYLTIINEITLDDIIAVAKKRPEFLTMYNWTVKDLTEKQILEIIRIGNQEFLDSLNIDMSNLSIYERFKMIKANNFDTISLEKFGAFKTDFINPYHIREILISTGEEHVEKLNLTTLSPSDWVAVLRHQRHLYNKININNFLDGDIYNLIEICMFLPEFIDYITDKNAYKISSRGWEKLLVKYGHVKKIIDLCDFSKLEQRSWVYLQKEKPELLIYKL